MSYWATIFDDEQTIADLGGVNSTVDLTYTYSLSRWSCMRSFYFFHIGFCFLMFFAGVMCFITRLHSSIKFMHAGCGRLYMISLLCSNVTAMLIHNSGLAAGVLISFIFVISGACVGWTVIKFHENEAERAALSYVEQQAKNEELGPGWTLRAAVDDAKVQLAASKTFLQRLLSFKAMHGTLMFMSWFNTSGRIGLVFARWTTEFTCWTYPAWKPVNTDRYATAGMELEGKPITMLPIHAPDLPFSECENNQFLCVMRPFLVPAIAGIAIGVAYSMMAVKIENRRKSIASISPPQTDNQRELLK